jgi:hypothetical protein
VIVANQDGKPTSREARTFSFALTPEQAIDLVNIGVNPSLDLQLPGGGRYQIRAAIRDENSSEIGSAYQYVYVPDFNEPRITLSSIDLSSGSRRPEFRKNHMERICTGIATPVSVRRLRFPNGERVATCSSGDPLP